MKNIFIKFIYSFFLLLFLSHANAASWKDTSPGAGGWYMAVGVTTDGSIVVGSDLSGAYITNDQGVSWKAIGATKGLTVPHVSAVGIHPSNANIILLGTEAGIFRSANKGSTFTKVLSLPTYITAIQAAPSNPNIWYAVGHNNGTSADASFYISLDNGITWKRQSGAFNGVRGLKVIVHPQKSSELYVLSGADRWVNNIKGVVYKSLDSGRTWKQVAVNLGEVVDFAFSKVNTSELFLSTKNGIYFSPNNGVTWINTKISPAEYQDNNKSYLVGYSLWMTSSAKNPVRAVSNAITLWGTNNGIQLATKTGNNFSWISLNKTDSRGAKLSWETPDYWHFSELGAADLRSNFYTNANGVKGFSIHPKNDQKMVHVNTQWAFKTDDGGASFANIFTNKASNAWQNRGLNNINAYDVAASRWSINNVLFVGYADLGCWRSLNNGISWESCQALGKGWSNNNGGNMTTIITDPTRTGVVWAAMGESVKGGMSLMRSKQSGRYNSWVDITQGIPQAERRFILGLSVSAKSSATNRTLFVTANGNIYRSQNDGSSWTKVFDCRAYTRLSDGIENYCTTTTVDYFNANIVYAAGSAGVFTSIDGGNTWKRTDSNRMSSFIALDTLFAPWGGRYFVSKIVADPLTPNQVYMSVFDQVGTNGGIWVGSKGSGWKQIYKNPFMRSVSISPFKKGELFGISSKAYVAGEYSSSAHGVVFYDSAQKKWFSMNQGLPYPNVSSLAYTSKQGQHLLGTMGQGAMKNW